MAAWNGPFIWNSIDAWKSNFSDGYQFGDFLAGWAGIDRNRSNTNSAGKELYGDRLSTFEEYSGIKDPYSLTNRVNNIFTGKVTSAEKNYQNYLSGYEFYKNQLATAKANQETYAREDTAVERLMAQYLKAGLNPYMLVSGGSSLVAPSSQSQRAQYKKRALQEGEADSKMMNTAVKILALILLKKVIK